ncbi:marine proteobacterial sortase target protein [Amylibacter sp.]|nr:marine proteobacterial sortase target protein [Amylibacter sp.]
MPIFLLFLCLSLISFGIIKRSEFYEHQIKPKQIFSPILAGLIILKNAVVGFTLIILLALSFTSPLRAEYSPKQPSINLDDVESGQLLMRSGNELSSAILLSTDIKIVVAGSASRTIVSQRFINTGQTWAEGVYVFPIGKGAAVDTLKLRIGERFIEGIIKEKLEAKIIYEEAKAEGKKASLIEQQKPNLFTNKIANIGPGEVVVVQIEFQSKLLPKDGSWELRVPLVSAPRFDMPAIEENIKFGNAGFSNTNINAEYNENIDIKVIKEEELFNPVEISIDLNTGFELNSLKSAFHKVEIQKITNGHHKINLPGPISSDRDFVLRWTAKDKDTQTSLFEETKGEYDHLLLTLNPPLTNKNNHSPNREIIFIQDISGSMSGEPIKQSKIGLEMAIKRLKPNDKFNIVLFNDSYSSYARTPVLATAKEREKAIRYVRRLSAENGTDMYPALSFSLNNFRSNKSVLKQLIFLTDGAVTQETELFSLINSKLKTSRLFTIGIGSAPNSFFMTRAAEIGRGSHIHIGDMSEISVRMEELFNKIENPAITDLELILPKGFKAEVYPNPLPDLYVGDPLSIAIRGKNASGMAQITGNIGNQKWVAKIPLDQGAKQIGIAKLWAREKISNLERNRVSLNSNENQKAHMDRKLLQTALSYGLVSRLSSMVAVDITPSRPVGVELGSTKLKAAIPDGWDAKQFDYNYNQIVPQKLQQISSRNDWFKSANLDQKTEMQQLPQTSLNWKVSILFALLSLLLGLVTLSTVRRKNNV